MTGDDKLTRLKERLSKAYEAEERALEAQSTGNAEGEQHSVASLSAIRALIKDLEEQIDAIEGRTMSVTMAWGMRV
ncbi:hypothetical protein OIX85_003856 [Vibrio parahaemolyticus]|uniref:hypothetical protein n=1 Tax=Vibrio alginolyticus TaxID=663 RepID=UPI0035C66273|nr:hypothetical protein [Vibrio parahaemolyticus]